MDNKKSYGTTEVAKMIRRKLAEQFPGVKFSVRSDKYAGGSSIDISWQDGPTWKTIEQITNEYSSKGFDGSIDLSYYIDHWLMPDGYTVKQAHSSGTSGSMGFVQPFSTDKPHPQAELVSLSSGYVHAQRNMSKATLEAILKQLQAERTEPEIQTLYAKEGYNGSGELANDTNTAHSIRINGEWIDQYIYHIFGTMDLTPKPEPKTETKRATVDAITVRHNVEMNGIEVIFPNKPDQSIIDELKARGFRWSFKQALWYIRYTETAFQWAQSLGV